MSEEPGVVVGDAQLDGASIIGGDAGAVQRDRTSVGLVAGTEDSTPLLFSVALAQDAYLQLDDVVVTVRAIPEVGPVMTAGVVTQVRARHEGASFGSDVFLISDGVLPAQVQEIAEVTTTRVEPECYVPPRPGATARRATGAERAQALYFDQMDRKVPVGLGRDGNPIYVNLEFLDGTRGAHVSISGISGVATKTSFALFLLHSIFRCGVLGSRAVNAKALVFSVKGEDLLFLDHANTRLDDDLRDQYARIGLPAAPFASVGFFAPPTPDDATGRPNVTGRTTGVASFWWTVAEFCSRELLPYVFADAEDERNQYTMVVQLRRLERRISAADADVATAVEATGSRLTELYGIGPVLAGKILARVGPTRRFRSAAAFASFTGTAPLEVSSGEVVRHRLSRAGDRGLNHALHMMALTQIQGRTHGRAYYQRKRAEGKSHKEAMRCLKRRLPDVVYRRLRADALNTEADPGGHPRAAA